MSKFCDLLKAKLTEIFPMTAAADLTLKTKFLSLKCVL